MNVKHKIDEDGFGLFYIMEDGELIGEMGISIKDDEMTVHHTEVLPKAQGRGLSTELLQSMVKFARENKLLVIPMCTYVQAQFKRHAEEYRDVFSKP